MSIRATLVALCVMLAFTSAAYSQTNPSIPSPVEAEPPEITPAPVLDRPEAVTVLESTLRLKPDSANLMLQIGRAFLVRTPWITPSNDRADQVRAVYADSAFRWIERVTSRDPRATFDSYPIRSYLHEAYMSRAFNALGTKDAGKLRTLLTQAATDSVLDAVGLYLADRVLHFVPQDGILVLQAGDAKASYTDIYLELLYLQIVRGVRPDLSIMHLRVLQHLPYLDALLTGMPGVRPIEVSHYSPWRDLHGLEWRKALPSPNDTVVIPPDARSWLLRETGVAAPEWIRNKSTSHFGSTDAFTRTLYGNAWHRPVAIYGAFIWSGYTYGVVEPNGLLSLFFPHQNTPEFQRTYASSHKLASSDSTLVWDDQLINVLRQHTESPFLALPWNAVFGESTKRNFDSVRLAMFAERALRSALPVRASDTERVAELYLFGLAPSAQPLAMPFYQATYRRLAASRGFSLIGNKALFSLYLTLATRLDKCHDVDSTIRYWSHIADTSSNRRFFKSMITDAADRAADAGCMPRPVKGSIVITADLRTPLPIALRQSPQRTAAKDSVRVLVIASNLPSSPTLEVAVYDQTHKSPLSTTRLQPVQVKELGDTTAYCSELIVGQTPGSPFTSYRVDLIVNGEVVQDATFSLGRAPDTR